MFKLKLSGALALLLVTSQAYSAINWKQGHVIGDVGWYWGSEGKAQHINIATLIGDNFSVTKDNDSNYILGLGYMIDGGQYHNVDLSFGIHAYYLGQTEVAGLVTQEQQFTNLSYHYYLSYLPVYLAGKGIIATAYPGLSITIDIGVGPNLISASNFTESSLNSNSIPENIFSNQNSIVFSGMLGLGVRYLLDNKYPVELGYRFFSLGGTDMKSNNSAVLSSLSTGNNYANALTLTVSS